MDDLDELVSAIDLGSARGKRAASASLEVVRALDESDLPLLLSPPPVSQPNRSLRVIRQSHHQLAQLLAKGCEQAEASAITGYAPAYISLLATTDPSFRELLSHYRGEREQVFIDVLERMKVLGLSFQDELQRRLEDAPEDFSRREIMEAIDLLLVKPTQRGSTSTGSSGAPSSVSVNVKFVQASPPTTASTLENAPSGPFVDLEFEDLPS